MDTCTQQKMQSAVGTILNLQSTGTPVQTCLGLSQGVRKMHQQLQQAREAVVDRSLPRQTAKIVQPHATSLDADLQEAAQVRSKGTPQVGMASLLNRCSTRIFCLSLQRERLKGIWCTTSIICTGYETNNRHVLFVECHSSIMPSA